MNYDGAELKILRQVTKKHKHLNVQIQRSILKWDLESLLQIWRKSWKLFLEEILII